MCDDCTRVETVFSGLRASEDAVAKVLNISEVAQIARAELRYRQYLLAQWNTLAAQAVKRASSMARQGKSADAIARAVRKIMQRWADVVVPRAKSEMDKIYRLARTAGHKKVTGQTKASLTYDTPNLTELTVEKALPGFAALPAFDVIDDEAIAALQGQQVLWIGEHYDTNLAAGIQTTARETMLEAGRNRAVAGQLMQERMAQQFAHVRTPGGFHGSTEQYFEGLAANAATVARAHGQLSSFMRVGATRYEIVNPRDRRTCPVCNHMDGKTFTVQQGANQMFAELKATDPDEIKKVHPWHSKKELDKISAKPGQLKGKAGAKDSADLANAGFSIPPFHFRCRCAVDIDSDEGVIAVPQTPPTPKKPAKPLGRPTPKPKPKPAPKPKPKPGLKPTGTAAEKAILNRLALGTIESRKPIGVGVMGADKAAMAHEGKTGNAVLKLAKDERKLRNGIPEGLAYKREEAAYRIDQAMGGKTIVPPTVTRNLGAKAGGEASLQTFVEGARTIKDPEVQTVLREMIKSGAVSREASTRRMFLLDVISGNDDRHSMNVMFKVKATKAGKKTLQFIGIDNGLTFPGGDGPMRWIFAVPDVVDPKFKYARSVIKLNATSQKELAKLTMEKVASTLKAVGGIDDAAIRATMIRVRAMQINPKVIAEVEGMFGKLGPGGKVMNFMNTSHTAPAKLRPIGTSIKEWSDELKNINKIVGG